MSTDRPFFYLQHETLTGATRHPSAGKVVKGRLWDGANDGTAARILADYPNCVEWDGGSITLTGVTLHFASADVGGVPVEEGVYTGKATPNAESNDIADRIVGGGRLKVGKFGLMLVVE